MEHKYGGKHQRILLVSHAAPIIGLARVLVGDRTLPLRIGTCSITELKPKDASSNAVGNWVATKLGDGSHLKEGASRDWGLEDAVYIDDQVGFPHIVKLFTPTHSNVRLSNIMGNQVLRTRRTNPSASRFTFCRPASKHNPRLHLPCMIVDFTFPAYIESIQHLYCTTTVYHTRALAMSTQRLRPYSAAPRICLECNERASVADA